MLFWNCKGVQLLTVGNQRRDGYSARGVWGLFILLGYSGLSPLDLLSFAWPYIFGSPKSD